MARNVREQSDQPTRPPETGQELPLGVGAEAVTLEDVEPLAAVRRRGAFLFSALLWAAAVGGLLGIAGYTVVVFNLGIEAGERVRRALGLRVPEAGPDWYLLSVMGLLALIPLLLLVLSWSWYNGIWKRRLAQVWQTKAERRRFARLRPLPVRATGERLEEQAAYLAALLVSPVWRGYARSAPGPFGGRLSDAVANGALATEQGYRAAAEALLREIEEDVAERAIATGLIVGIGPSRMDRLTIVVGALEMQLHVLGRLGRRPSLSTWMELIKRTAASFFFSTYLNREDMMWVGFTIRKLAMGLEVTAELGEDAGEMLAGLDDDGEAVEDALEGLDDIPMLGGVLKGARSLVSTAGPVSLGIGAAGLRQVADLTRSAGDELLQGALAGGVLYYHGMAIAADALALDQAHRNSGPMIRSPRQGAMKTAVVAGKLLRDQVKRYRGAYRERRRALLRLAKRYVPGRKGDSRPAEPSVELAPGSAERSAWSRKVSSLRVPWRSRKQDEDNASHPSDG